VEHNRGIQHTHNLSIYFLVYRMFNYAANESHYVAFNSEMTGE